MAKVSISLPNNALITLESDETEVIQQIVSLALRDLMQPSGPEAINGALPTPPAKTSNPGTSPIADDAANPVPAQPDVSYVEAAPPDPVPAPDPDIPPPPGPDPEPLVQPPQERPPDPPPLDPRSAEQAARSAAAYLAFIQFCHSANPIGDMRKVVVAAEAAAQFLDMPSVSAEDLEELFERIGWLQPHSFTQTLRNAGRSKFRWLERVPGRSGRYTVTELGRSKISNT